MAETDAVIETETPKSARERPDRRPSIPIPSYAQAGMYILVECFH